MHRLTHNRSRIRFTLIEMLLAMLIFMIIVTLIGTCMFTLQQSISTVSSKSNNLAAFQRLDRVFSSSFRNAVPFYWKNPTGSRTSIFNGGSNSISFAYLHRVADVNDGGIRFIMFSLENGDLVAYYKKVPILPWDQTTLAGATKEVLATKISNITFSYADFNLQSNTVVWSSNWANQINNYNIPLAISVTVTWQNGSSETWLRRTSGSGRFESLGLRSYTSGGGGFY